MRHESEQLDGVDGMLPMSAPAAQRMKSGLRMARAVVCDWQACLEGTVDAGAYAAWPSAIVLQEVP
jgi:hypothetical protein